MIQAYAWGDESTLAELVGFEPTGEPAAELWMGAHDRGPSVLADGRTLTDLVAENPAAALGPEVAEIFGELPFLFKVLAIGDALSIQTHPTLEGAQAGFERENEEGVPLDAPNRVYRDANHKPELIVALTRFEGLCGFRKLEQTKEVLEQLGLASPPGGDDEPIVRFVSLLAEGDLAAAVSWTLGLDAESATTLIASILKPASECLDLELIDACYVDAVAAVKRLGDARPSDPGVAVALLLNHVWLEPGEGVFLGAGNLHAYLGGVGVEVMANSDNVVRGGLTPKHVDIPELCAVTTFEADEPPVQRRTEGVQIYDSPVSEFSLTRYDLTDEEEVHDLAEGPSIVLVTEGHAIVRTGEDIVDLGRGGVAFLSASEVETTIAGIGTAWVAAIGRD